MKNDINEIILEELRKNCGEDEEMYSFLEKILTYEMYGSHFYVNNYKNMINKIFDD